MTWVCRLLRRPWQHDDRDLAIAAGQQIIQRNAWALGYLALGIGLVFLLQSPRRFGSPGWHDMLRVPGSDNTWGTVIWVAGVFIIYGLRRDRLRVQRIGFTVAWWWFFALLCFQVLAGLHDHTGTANFVGVPLWLYGAFIYRLRAHYCRPEHRA